MISKLMYWIKHWKTILITQIVFWKHNYTINNFQQFQSLILELEKSFWISLTSIQNMHLHCWILYISLNGQSIKQILHKMGGCSESLLLAVSLIFGEFTDTFVVLWVLLFIMEGCLWERETWLVYLEVIREWFIDNIEVHLEQITEEAPDLNLFWGCMPCREI